MREAGAGPHTIRQYVVRDTKVRAQLNVLLDAVESFEQRAMRDASSGARGDVAGKKDAVDQAADALGRELAALERRNKILLAIIPAVASIIVGSLTLITSQKKCDAAVASRCGPATAAAPPVAGACSGGAIGTAAELTQLSSSNACMAARDCQRLVLTAEKSLADSCVPSPVDGREGLRALSAQNACIRASSCQAMLSPPPFLSLDGIRHFASDANQLMSVSNCAVFVANDHEPRAPASDGVEACKKRLLEAGWIVRLPKEEPSIDQMVQTIQSAGRTVLDSKGFTELHNQALKTATDKVQRELNTAMADAQYNKAKADNLDDYVKTHCKCQ